MGIGLNLVRRWRDGRRGRWVVGGAVLAVGLLGSASAYALTGPAASTGTPPPTSAVDRGDVTVAVAAVGTLRPSQQRQLSFATAGTVTDVRVRPGDTVAAGQVLAVLDDAPAKAAVTAAEDALSQATDGLASAEQAAAAPSPTSQPSCAGSAGGGTVRAVALSVAAPVTPTTSAGSPDPSGSAVVAGSPSASGSPGPSGSPTARPTSSPTATRTPAPGHTPTSGATSADPGAGRGPGAGTGPSGAGCAGAGAGSAGRTGGSGSSGSSGGSGSAGASGGTDDPVLRAHQQVTSAELRLAQARDQLAGTTITAPVTGRILSVAGQVGGQVTAGAAFIQLGVVDDMQVAASFPEVDAGRLRPGLTATVTLANRPGEEFPAKLIQVDPAGTSDGQLVRYGVLIAFEQVPADLLVGQSANVRVQVATVGGVLRVPSTAVHAGADGTGTVQPAGAAEPRQVVVGVRGDQYTEIRSGLTEADRVLTSW